MEKAKTLQLQHSLLFIWIISFEYLKQKDPSKKYSFLSLWSWQSCLLERIKAHDMWDGTASQEVFHFQAEATPELVLPAHLHEVVLLRFRFQGIGTSPLRVPKLSLKVFFHLFYKTSLSSYSFLFWLSIKTSLTHVHLHSCMSEYVLWCMFIEILACAFIWNVSVFCEFF